MPSQTHIKENLINSYVSRREKKYKIILRNCEKWLKINLIWFYGGGGVTL